MAKKVKDVQETNEVSNSVIDGIMNEFKDIEGLNFNEHIDVVPTDLDGFNTILGGGIPVGKLILLVGLAGGGKSSLSGAIIKAFQACNEKSIAFYLDSEQGTDVKRLASLGCNTDRTVLISQGLTLESVMDILKKIVSYKVNNNAVDIPYVVVLDSETETLTKKHFETIEPSKIIGHKANLESLIVPNIAQICNKYKITFVMIGQLRDKIQMSLYQASTGDGIKGLGDKKISGSNVLKYAPFQIIYIKPKEELDKDVYGFSGVVSEVKIIKNKLYTPHIKMEFVLNYRLGFNDFWSKYGLLQGYKMIKGTAWQYLDQLPDKKFRKKEAEYLYMTDEEFRKAFNEVYKECEKDICGETHIVEDDEEDISDDSGTIIEQQLEQVSTNAASETFTI
jgi:RecA/RadA recombinase